MTRKRWVWVTLLLVCIPGWFVYRAAHRSTLNHELILAAAGDDPWTVQTLLNQGADPNTIEDGIQSVGWQRFLDLLLHHSPEGPPVCALSQAIASDHPDANHLEVVRLLLEHHANPNIKLPGSTALPIRAVTTIENDKLLALFLEHGVDPNMVDRTGGFNTPLLMYAVKEDHLSLVKVLLDHGADPSLANANGDSALMWAAAEVNTEMAQLLVTRHADVNHQNSQGQCALTYVFFIRANEQRDIVRPMLAAGADVNALDHQGCTPFLLGLINYGSCLGMMLEHGGDVHKAVPASAPTQTLMVNMRTADSDRMQTRTSVATPGTTPLMLAAYLHDADLVRGMLAKGADANARNAQGKTALDFGGDIPAIRALLHRAGAHR